MAAAIAAAPAIAGDAPDNVTGTSLDGWVTLRFFGPAGRPMTFFERTAAGLEPLSTLVSDANGIATLAKAVPWRCDRAVRRFHASTSDPAGGLHEGDWEIRTPSCATRVELRTPRHVAIGNPVIVRLADRWGLGDRDVVLCTVGAGRPRACRHVRLPATGTARRSLHVYRSGRLRVSVNLDGFRTVRFVAAGTGTAPPPVIPTVLATGDSTIQILDGMIADRLRYQADVTGVSRPGSGLSAPLTPAWAAVARRQVQRLRPRVTVVSIGANEGYPVGETPCCGAGWTAALARRARELMRTYTSRSGTHVLWITQALPADPRRREIVAAVNAAAVHAARGLPAVRLLDVEAVIAPYRVSASEIEVGGRRTPIVQHDGKHLTVETATIVARAAVSQVRAGDWL